MSRKYTDELKSWIDKKASAGRKNSYLISFLAVRDDVQQAMAEGYPMHIIWSHLHDSGKIAFKYDTFRRYVRQYIHTKKREILDATDANLPPSKPEPQIKQTPQPGRFEFNATPDKKDLI